MKVITVSAVATRFAKLLGRRRKLHLVVEVNGLPGPALCGRTGPWAWSINRPFSLGHPVCKLCSAVEG